MAGAIREERNPFSPKPFEQAVETKTCLELKQGPNSTESVVNFRHNFACYAK